MQQELKRYLLGHLIPESLLSGLFPLIEEYQKQKPAFLRPDWSYSSLERKESFHRIAQKYVHTFSFLKAKGVVPQYGKFMHMFDAIGQFYLTWNAFLSTIELLGDEEQAEYWRSRVFAGVVLGAYAQTEIGHGSDVKQLQTTARFDSSTNEFILNSPKATSAKFWPGLLGKFCNHVVIQAQTEVAGTRIGVQTFVIRIRDNEYKLLPGIQAGDIGPKLGFEGVDNGFLRLNNVRVGQNAMLSRFVRVKDGKAEGHDNKEAIKYGYGSMLNLRVALTTTFAFTLANLACISAPQTKEQVATVRRTLSKAVGMILLSGRVGLLFQQYLAAYQKKDSKQANKLLALVHILSATMKAQSSWMLVKETEAVMFSNPSCIYQGKGLLKLHNDYVPAVTYEGDNNVLLQQTAAYLLKVSPLPVPANQVQGRLVTLLNAELDQLKQSLKAGVESGLSFKTLWNEKYQSWMVQIAKEWGYIQQLILYEEALASLEGKSFLRHVASTRREFTRSCLDNLRTLTREFEGRDFGEEMTEENYSALAANFRSTNLAEEYGFTVGGEQAHSLLRSVESGSSAASL